MPRRSISQSLSAREIDFIKAPLVEAKKEAAPVKSPKPKKPTEEVKAEAAPTSSKPQPKKHASTKPQPSHNQEPWVTITTRLPNSLHSQLRRAAFERSERGDEPSTIQDILAMAASTWLEKNKEVIDHLE